MNANGKWKLEGFDTFDNEPYSLEGNYDDEAAAKEAARKRLEELEKTQPSATSGGQGRFGIQDQVFIVRPDGSNYCFFD